jgi:hypothetical protein
LDAKYEYTKKSRRGIIAYPLPYNVDESTPNIEAFINELNKLHSRPGLAVNRLKNTSYITTFIKNNHEIFFKVSPPYKYESKLTDLYSKYFSIAMNHPAFVRHIRAITQPMADKAKKSYCKSTLANFLYKSYTSRREPMSQNLPDFINDSHTMLDEPQYYNICSTVNKYGVFKRDYTNNELNQELTFVFNAKEDLSTKPIFTDLDDAGIKKLEQDMLDIASAFALSYVKSLDFIKSIVNSSKLNEPADSMIEKNINKGFLASIRLIFEFDKFVNAGSTIHTTSSARKNSKAVVDFATNLMQKTLAPQSSDSTIKLNEFKQSIQDSPPLSDFTNNYINNFSYTLWQNDYFKTPIFRANEFSYLSSSNRLIDRKDRILNANQEPTISKTKSTDSTLSTFINCSEASYHASPGPFAITKCAKAKINTYLKWAEGLISIKAFYATIKAVVSKTSGPSIVEKLKGKLVKTYSDGGSPTGLIANLTAKVTPMLKTISTFDKTSPKLYQFVKKVKNQIMSLVISILSIIFLIAMLAFLAPPILFLLSQIKELLLWIGKTFVFFLTWPLQIIRNTSSTHTSHDDIVKAGVHQFFTPTMIVFSLTLSLIIFSVSLIAYEIVYSEFMHFAYDTFLREYASLNSSANYLASLGDIFSSIHDYNYSGLLLWLISYFILPVLIIGYLLVKSLSLADSLLATVSKSIGVFHRPEQSASPGSVAMIINKFYKDIQESTKKLVIMDHHGQTLASASSAIRNNTTRNTLDPNDLYKLSDPADKKLLDELLNPESTGYAITLESTDEFKESVKNLLDSQPGFHTMMENLLIKDTGMSLDQILKDRDITLEEFAEKAIIANMDHYIYLNEGYNVDIMSLMKDDIGTIGSGENINDFNLNIDNLMQELRSIQNTGKG